MDGDIIVPLVIAVVFVGVRVFLHFKDKDRILAVAQQKGWQDITISWAPFAPGWFFEKGERHYLVSYRDRNGKRCQQYCKTSLLTGIFWRDSAG